MKERIAHICSLFPRAPVYADVGCDHGFMAKYALESGLCEKVYITDIHAGSLKKAETLLEKYICEGRCVPILCDGLCGIPERCDFVLIAGMGGEEIVKILKRDGIPARFLLQPMKNSEKVRRFLVEAGAKIERDYTFSEGTERRKYYDLLLGSATGGSEYCEKAFRFGRDNINGSSPYPFLFQAREELAKTEERLCLVREKDARAALIGHKTELEEAINEAQRNL